MLELNDVSLADGKGRRIANLSLLVPDGGSLLVTGADVSVRAALVRAMMGMYPVTDGLILREGERVTPLSARYFRRQTAFLPDGLSLTFPHIHALTDALCALCHHADVRPTAKELRGEWERMGLGPEVTEADWTGLPVAACQLMALAVARLMEKPMVVIEEVESPRVAEMLRQMADEGQMVVATSADEGLAKMFSQRVSLNE